MAQQTVVVDIALLGKMAGYIEMLVKDPYSTVFAPLSDIYRTFGLHEEAIAVAQKGSEMVPTYAPGFVALGRALAEVGDPAGASHAYRQALLVDSVNLAALTGLASSCLGCGQNDEALALLTQAESIAPDDEVVKTLFPVVRKLTTSLALSSPPSLQSPVPLPTEVPITVEEEQSESIAGAAVSLPTIATATLADIYIKQGFPERAMKVFSDLLAEDPGNSEIRQRYDELVLQVNASVITTLSPDVIVSPKDVAPVSRANVIPDKAGKDALVDLYGRWLVAINKRRGDVH